METVQSAGLDGIEINCYILDLPDILSFKRPLSLGDFDCSKASLHSNHIDFNPGSPNPYTRRAGIAQLKEEIIIAEEHGIRTLTIHPGFVKKIPRSMALSFFWDSLQEALDYCPLNKTRLCLENMDNKADKLCNNTEEIRSTLDRFPNLCLTVDFAHLGLNRMDIGAFLNEFDKRIAHIHISGVIDGVAHGKVPLTESRIDFRPYLRRFKDRDIAVVIENRSWENVLSSKTVIDTII